MSNNKSKIILICAAIAIIGLAILYRANHKKVQVIKTHYADTNETEFSEFAVRNGDTVLHGKYTQYNAKGNKVAEGNYKNGELDGKNIYYYDDGTIETIQFEKNKMMQEGIWNYPNGKIRKYIIYDEFRNAVFLVRYAEDGYISYEGLPLIEFYQFKIARKEKFKIKINQVLKVGDVLKYKYLLADIPHAKRDFKIQSAGSSTAKITKVPHRGIDVEEVLTKKGINTITAIVRYEFDDKEKTVINDTLSFDVEVF